MGGSLLVHDSMIQSCRSDLGAGLRVVGGDVIVSRTQFEDNEASSGGGAIQADGGNTVLTNQTRLRWNRAPEGRSIQVAVAAHVQYELPAPIAHWVFISDGGTRSTLSVGNVNDDFPYLCSGGIAENM